MTNYPRDHTKWNFDALQEVVEGPLLNPKRLEEAIKILKFVRGFLKFFHPFEHRFSDMKRKVRFTLVFRCVVFSLLIRETLVGYGWAAPS